MYNMEKVQPNDFLDVFPSDERDFCTKSLQLETLSNMDEYQEKLIRLLRFYPYPTVQILQICWSKSKQSVQRAFELTLMQLLEQNIADMSEEFINFIANLPLKFLKTTLQQSLINHLSIQPQNDKLYLALLCHSDETFIKQLLDKCYQIRFNSFDYYPTKEFIIYTAVKQQLHFVPLSSEHKNLNISQASDIATRSNLLLLKIVNEFAQTTKPIAQIAANISRCLEGFDIFALPVELQEIHKLFYADFQRLLLIVDFLKKFPHKYHTVTVETLLNANCVLRLIFENDINASFNDARRLLDKIQKLELKMSLKNLCDLEMETLTYFFALSTILDVILADSTLATEQYFVSKMQKLNSTLRQMRNIDVLCSLFEDIFQLVFLRWENMRHSNCFPATDVHQFKRSKSMKSSNPNSTVGDEIGAGIPKSLLLSNTASSGAPIINGFICRGRALQCIFSFLKNFVTKKLHAEDYKNASERIKIRFQRIFEIISEALWKYSVIEKIDDSIVTGGVGAQQHLTLDTEELLQLVQMHVDSPREKSSSDDESRDRCNYVSLTRRKTAKKRRRATISGTLVTQAGNNRVSLEQYRERANVMVSSASAAMQQNDLFHQLNARNIMMSVQDRGIIPRMLVSPENLAIMALGINNFNDVKYIIETFNLHNTDLDRELNFMEQKRQVKQKLASIYAKYQMEERKSNTQGELKATVEQIKNVVAKGFEASKIISVIDNFAQAQKLKQPENIKMLLTKHCSHTQYARFLPQFEERNLNAIIITDLILNLPLNHEITTNILMVIKRQQTCEVDAFAQLPSLCKADLNSSPKVQLQLPKDIGCTPLLENLCQCLRLLDNASMRSLLCDSYYSLKPHKLALELERERAFMAVFKRGSGEFGRVVELRTHAQLFQNLKSKQNYFTRFVSYVNQLAKLLKLRDKNLELYTSELLKYDPCDVIGELLFEQNMTPLEIESNVAALNLDLVHVIALNICPEMVGKCGNSSRAAAASKLKQKTIYNYIWNHNRLLAFLLQAIDKPDDLASDNNLQPLFLQRLLNLPALIKLAQLYGGKKLIAALHAEQIDLKLIESLKSKAKQVELLLLKFGSPATRKSQHASIDKLIADLICEDGRNVHLAIHMHDVAQKANLIHENFTKIATTRLAQELIESTLQHREASSRVPQNLRAKLENTLADITVYAKVSEVLQFESWPQAYDFGLTSPYSIFEKLLKMQHYKLCYKWCKVVKLSQTTTFEQQKRVYFGIILEALLAYNEVNSNPDVKLYLLQIMATFPTQDCCNFLQENKYSFRCVDLLKYALKFLNENCEAVDSNLKNLHISIVIFEQLNASERDQFWKLLKYPLLIIEQLIMNAKFEILSRVLKAVRPNLNARSSEAVSAVTSQECAFCFDKRGNVYDIHARSDVRRKDNGTLYIQTGGTGEVSSSVHSTFILLNFNLYQKDHVITNECIDLLLRIYATKALDYQIADSSAGTEHNSVHSTTDMQQSIDSLWGAFQMPKEAPSRDDWIRDDDAVHCMCCRRAVFTMLIRRHHCRRCGRVVCFACSTHRMLIPALYADVEVRTCNDCHNFTEATNGELTQLSCSLAEQEMDTHATMLVRKDHPFKWRLSGNITHDKLLREEFCYEHAPSVALCLSILDYHLDQKKCVDLLLFHCRNMEKLIVPNPEVDYELIAKMMNCLALAAKVRGGRAEIETICDHSEVIMSLVQNGCESLIPVGPLKNHSIRKLADSLVQAEKWELALDVHLKYGLPTAGVMAAHGLSCLRAGCFDTAREKLSHCMPKLSHELANSKMYNFILSTTTNEQNLDFNRDHDFPQIKRPLRGPALLLEILKIIESIASTNPQPETLHRASIIRSSNTSLSSLLSRRKEMIYHAIPMHEPALNILTTLANLKRLAKGHYEGHESGVTKLDNKSHLRRQTRAFEEAIHYVLTYGSHVDIIQFLMRQQEISAALKYCVFQNLEADFFIHNIFLVALRCGEVPLLIEHIHTLDAGLNVFREVLIQTCRYLESKNLLNSLYQLQMLLCDPVRASMTCVKFYSMGCENFQQLHRNAQHLHNAHKHLLAELELAKWENINMENVSKRRSGTPSLSSATASFPMQMDARSLNRHINTILKQLDVGKFLATCERDRGNVGTVDGQILITEKILKQIRLEAGKIALPTLFDSLMEKIQICILVLLSGKNIDEGFGLAYGIIQDYKIPCMKVFGATAKYLARNHRLPEVDKLLNCITSNNGNNHSELDDIIYIAIHSAANSHEPEVKSALDNLVKKIHSVEQRISCHIFMGQLKSAYLLANKYERLGDIKRILRQAEISNQVHMKKLCEKKLNINPSPL